MYKVSLSNHLLFSVHLLYNVISILKEENSILPEDLSWYLSGDQWDSIALLRVWISSSLASRTDRSCEVQEREWVPIITSLLKYQHSKHKTVKAFQERDGPLFRPFFHSLNWKKVLKCDNGTYVMFHFWFTCSWWFIWKLCYHCAISDFTADCSQTVGHQLTESQLTSFSGSSFSL